MGLVTVGLTGGGGGRLDGLVRLPDRRAARADAAHPGSARHGGARPLPGRRGGRAGYERRGRPPAAVRPTPLSLEGVRTYPLARAGAARSAWPTSPARTRRGASFAAFLDALPACWPCSPCARWPPTSAARASAASRSCGAWARTSSRSGSRRCCVDLMERGFVTGLALNGAGIVHDFELAVAGQTSEEVDEGLGSGAFGMAARDGRGGEPRHRRRRPRRPRPGRGAGPLPRAAAAAAPRP